MSGRQQLEDLQDKGKEDTRNDVGRRASEQTRSYIQEEITEGNVEEWIF